MWILWWIAQQGRYAPNRHRPTGDWSAGVGRENRPTNLFLRHPGGCLSIFGTTLSSGSVERPKEAANEKGGGEAPEPHSKATGR
jgi:hypothetical protein